MNQPNAAPIGARSQTAAAEARSPTSSADAVGAGAAPVPPPVHVIVPSRGLRSFDVQELWHYRDLLFFLTWREISIRYKQTLLGVLWAIIQPVLTVLVFTVFLGRLAKVPSDGVPYPIFAFLGLLPWTYFSNAITRSASSLVSNANLLSKVYFPRVLIPLSGTLSALVDFIVAFVVLVAMMAYYGMAPGLSALMLIPLVALTALAAMGTGLWLAALNVQYRDVQHALPFLMQIWLYASPVVYPMSIVPERWRLWMGLNPVAGAIEAYRAAMLGRPLDWQLLGVSCAATVVLLVLGAWQFQRMERVFADVV